MKKAMVKLATFSFLDTATFLVLAAAVCFPVAVLHDFLPIFDGGWLLGSVLAAADNPTRWQLLNWGDHNPSFFYTALLALPQLLLGFGGLKLLLTNWLLFILFLSAIYRCLVLLDKETGSRAERLIFTAVIGSTPVAWAGVVNPNLNFASMVFGTLLLLALLQGRMWFFALWGVALCFSQETGVLVYGVVTLAVLLMAVGRVIFSRQSFSTVFRVLPAFIPGILFLLYSFLSPTGSSLTNNKASTLCWVKAPGFYFFLRPNLDLPAVQNFAFNIFALNFQWILTGIAVAGFLFWLARKALGQSRSGAAPGLGWVCFFLLAWCYAISRCPLFNNPKYILAAIPLVGLVSYASAASIITCRFARMCAWVIAVFLFQLSLWNSIDPLSRRFYGTFHFGEAEMYHTTSRTSECCGYGQDQLLYNLQFTNIHYLVTELVRTLKLSSGDHIASTTIAWTFDHFEKDTYQRKLRAPHPLGLEVREPLFVAQDPRVESFIFVEYPFAFFKDALNETRKKAEEKERIRVTRGKYSLSAARFVKKETSSGGQLQP